MDRRRSRLLGRLRNAQTGDIHSRQGGRQNEGGWIANVLARPLGIAGPSSIRDNPYRYLDVVRGRVVEITEEGRGRAKSTTLAKKILGSG